MIEILETVIYDRLLPKIGPARSPSQDAYRRERDAELLLVGIMDFTRRASLKNGGVYFVGSDISGAVDSVP